MHKMLLIHYKSNERVCVCVCGEVSAENNYTVQADNDMKILIQKLKLIKLIYSAVRWDVVYGRKIEREREISVVSVHTASKINLHLKLYFAWFIEIYMLCQWQLDYLAVNI